MTNPDLLLLHGAAGSAAQFEPLSPALSDHFRVRYFDFPAHKGLNYKETCHDASHQKRSCDYSH